MSTSGRENGPGGDDESRVSFHLSARDRVLPDGGFKCYDWEDLTSIIESNSLSALGRRPSDLHRYQVWYTGIEAEYGSTTRFLLETRLPRAWGALPFTPASAVPFQDPSDYCVLVNEWPYALAPGIAHLVVWSRTPIAVDNDAGNLTPESRAVVAAFVQRHFVDRLGPGGEDRVLWFKNWVALQSVPALAHIHVLVRDVEPAVLEEWTGGPGQVSTRDKGHGKEKTVVG